MRTIEQSYARQKNAVKVWAVMICVSVLLILSPAAADRLISFEASMAAAFVGLVMVIVSITMVVVYTNRKKLVASLSDGGSILDVWECADRYGENKGLPILAYFSVKGVFYAGKPYPLKSYECTIVGAELIDDGGCALSIVYTVPNSRNGALRHAQTISIPVPEGKEESAMNIAGYYTSSTVHLA